MENEVKNQGFSDKIYWKKILLFSILSSTTSALLFYLIMKVGPLYIYLSIFIVPALFILTSLIYGFVLYEMSNIKRKVFNLFIFILFNLLFTFCYYLIFIGIPVLLYRFS